MLLNTTLSMNELFGSKPKYSSLPLYSSSRSKISDAKYSIFPWQSSSPSLNSVFPSCSSHSADSLVNKFRYIFEHGPCHLDFKNKHAGINHDQDGTKWRTKELIFGRHSFWSKNLDHNPMLTKLASYKSSILKLLYSMKPENFSTPNILYNINHYLIPSPLAAASGISTCLTSAAASRISSSLTSAAASGISTSLKGALRHYHNNRRLTLAPKYYSKSARFIKHVKKHKVLYMVGLGFVTIFLIGSGETIPYSKRKHFVIVPASRDKSLGNFLFKIRKVGLVLSRDHPHSVRVRSISNQLLKALQSDLKIKQMSGLEYSSKDITSNVVEKKEVTVPWWRRTRFSTGHLEGLNWEVVVVDLNIKNAYVLPGGKIVVYRGILEHCKSDAQVATVIGHEVGHVVARHYAERFTKWWWFAIGMMIGMAGAIGRGFPPCSYAEDQLAEFILNPCSRSNEKEADYIGLLLMASAAYDPREAPKVYEMLDDNDSSDSKFKFIDDLFSTHSSGKKRAAALSKPKVMEEAMTIFSKVMEATRREDEECIERGFDVCES